MFEKAAKLKLRFDTAVGPLTVEDLWDLPLTSVRHTNLDGIARGLHSQLKFGEDISFVEPSKKSPEAVLIELRFEIAKHIIAAKQAENAAKKAALEKAEKRQRILEIMAQKQDEHLSSKSMDELRKELEDLEVI